MRSKTITATINLQFIHNATPYSIKRIFCYAILVVVIANIWKRYKIFFHLHLILLLEKLYKNNNTIYNSLHYIFYLGNFTHERIKQKEYFQSKISEQLQTLKNAMSSTSNLFWKCDPEHHIKDLTYFEVTQLLQVYKYK